MIKEFFSTRKGWGIETEKKLKYQELELQNYWAEIIKQKIEKTRKSILIEKNAEIELLQAQILDRKNEIKYLRESDLEVEKLKNELKAKIEHLDYQSKLLSEVQTRLAIQLGMNDSLIRDSEKLLKKEGA